MGGENRINDRAPGDENNNSLLHEFHNDAIQARGIALQNPRASRGSHRSLAAQKALARDDK